MITRKNKYKNDDTLTKKSVLHDKTPKATNAYLFLPIIVIHG